ncbi:MAG: NAD-dependent epimerase/dehydratase family protein [Candidatus Limnocylindria bacterium]
MRLLFIGGTGPVGIAATRAATALGHEVVVAHSGQHEPPEDLGARHVHGDRDDLVAPDGPVSRTGADVIVDTRTKVENAASVAACARAAGARRLIVVSSSDVYKYFVTGSGYESAGGRATLPAQTLPITEDAPRRTAPYPWAPPGHDNAAMERAIEAARHDLNVTVIRPAMIYGPGAAGREWTIVSRIKRGERRIELPDGGGQFFGRVALERVGRAVAAAAERAPGGFWPVNVVDPYGWTYAALVGEIGRILAWEWEPAFVRFEDGSHPFKTQSPYVLSDARLRVVLGVAEPDPRDALIETVRWLWDHGADHYPIDEAAATPTHRGPERRNP